ncbi:MAG: hypothetical protein Metus_0886 [Candidatus Methanosuratincola subterraneus]|uniref:Uncharacterized protein n=1 Tax=Methanosuratincola subterraneus TaxID=2593994 RepID=A0A444L5R2_METS7|nr:MAG: hypothetical protein Metus_0886 [Candidatus Methanosuratincola subterraneus]
MLAKHINCNAKLTDRDKNGDEIAGNPDSWGWGLQTTI